MIALTANSVAIAASVVRGRIVDEQCAGCHGW
jgi:hypothetical protein